MLNKLASAGFVGVLLSVSAAQTCYYPNGDIMNSVESSCNPDPTVHSPCCHRGKSQCMENGLCLQQNGLIGRHGCTDPTWQAPECPKYCNDPSFNSSSRLFPQSEDPPVFCCDGNCTITGGPFTVADSRVILNQTSKSTTKSTKCPSQISQKIGIGLGIGLPLLLAFVFVLCCLFWEKRRYAYLKKSYKQQEDKRREDEERFRMMYMSERNHSAKPTPSRRSTATSSAKSLLNERYPDSSTLPSVPVGSLPLMPSGSQHQPPDSKSPTELVGMARYELSHGAYQRAELPCSQQDIAEMPTARTPISWQHRPGPNEHTDTMDSNILNKDPANTHYYYIPQTYAAEDESPEPTLSRSSTAMNKTYYTRGLRQETQTWI